ncbi:MAG: transcriptional regulator [Halobacteria archaeon]
MTEYSHGTDSEIPEGTELILTSMPEEEFEKDSKERMEKAVEENEQVDHYRNFTDPKDVQKLLSPSRLEILGALLEKEFDSIRELADYVDRDYKDVHGDFELLHGYGIVEYRRDESRGKKPVVGYSDIRVEVGVKKAGTEV